MLLSLLLLFSVVQQTFSAAKAMIDLKIKSHIAMAAKDQSPTNNPKDKKVEPISYDEKAINDMNPKSAYTLPRTVLQILEVKFDSTVKALNRAKISHQVVLEQQQKYYRDRRKKSVRFGSQLMPTMMKIDY